MPSTTLLSTAVTRPATTSNTQDPTQKGTVYRFTCLFTHDVRRKNTKRWQDGYLSFHSFNGRVQVHDELKNFIGDTFYKEGLLDDGDELNLDRVGVLVQVGEKKSVEETDLTELLSKRHPKQVEQANGERSTAQPLRPQTSNAVTQTQRRWSGWAARAQMPTESPHAQRQAATAWAQKENEPVREPPRKRPRQDDEHIPLWQLLKTTRPNRSQVSATASNGSHPQSRTFDTPSAAPPTRKTPKTPGQSMFRVKEIIDITESSSDRIEPPPPAVQLSHEHQRPSSAVTADEDVDKPDSPVKNISHAQPQPPPIESRLASPKRVDDPGGVYNTPAALKHAKPPPKDVFQARPRTQAAAEQSEPQERLPPPQPAAKKPAYGPNTVANDEPAFAGPERPTRNTKGVNKAKTAAVEQPHGSADLSRKATKRKTGPSRADIIHSATKAAQRPPQSVLQAPSSPPICTESHISVQDLDPGEDTRPADVQKKPGKVKPSKPLRLASASGPKKRQLFAQTLTATKQAEEPLCNRRSPSVHRHTSIFEEEAEAGGGSPNEEGQRWSKPLKHPSLPSKAVEPEVITLEDDSQEAFEVIQPKAKRRKQAQRRRQDRTPPVADDQNPVDERNTAAVSTKDAEGGFPSINNQPDQRPAAQLETGRSLQQPIFPTTRISYGTAPLDARYLSQMVANMGAQSNASLRAQPAQSTVVQGPSQPTSAEPHGAAHCTSAAPPAPGSRQQANNASTEGPAQDCRQDNHTANSEDTTKSKEATSAAPHLPVPSEAQAQPEADVQAAAAAPQPRADPDPTNKAQPIQALTAQPTTTAPPLITAQAAASKTLTRPFRRVTSDVSPKKRPAAANRRPLKRAETISVPGERTRQQTAEREGSVTKEVSDIDKGAWSREAWDLFGACPAGRRERPVWPYDAAVASAVAGSV